MAQEAQVLLLRALEALNQQPRFRIRDKGDSYQLASDIEDYLARVTLASLDERPAT